MMFIPILRLLNQKLAGFVSMIVLCSTRNLGLFKGSTRSGCTSFLVGISPEKLMDIEDRSRVIKSGLWCRRSASPEEWFSLVVRGATRFRMKVLRK
jgi:hypothetical protein